MTSIIGIFILSLILSLSLTPFIGNIAKKFGIVDKPSDRKVHIYPVPRAGGVAIFLAMMISIIFTIFYPTMIFEQLKEPHIAMFASGATLVFALGIWDDIKGLSAGFKFAVQIMAACIAYAGGISIKIIGIVDMNISLGWLSLPFTVFWFLLVINAINLIDGLDGLAAGISLFTSLVMLIICISTKNYIVALGFAALSGATMGFLKYNFNPASIFMGDSGSYFLGYMLAGLSIMGSIKGSATVAILIPIIALGLPLIDTLFSPVRRFILGQKLFSPDKNHLHHRLLRMGLTHRNAVLILYGICILMGILSLITVHAKDESLALILIVIAAMVIIGIQKLGYVNYLSIEKVCEWFKDVTDEMGITQDRRNFLNLQIEIYESDNINSLWNNICIFLDRLGFDMAEMYIEGSAALQTRCMETGRLKSDLKEFQYYSINSMVWKRNGFDADRNICKECLLKMELPLIDLEGQSLGSIWLIKDLKRDAINHSTLRRVEHLRRTVLGSLHISAHN